MFRQLAFKFVLAGAIASTLTACIQRQKRELAFDETPLLNYDRLQGWKYIEKAPPAVGEFEATWYEKDNSVIADQPCIQVEDGDRTLTICDKVKQPSGSHGQKNSRAKPIFDTI